MSRSPHPARTVAAWLRAAKAAGAVSVRVEKDGSMEVRFVDAAPPIQHTMKGDSFADIEAALEKRLGGGQ
jgi:hypothetical protein